jgi:hypothetical protein
VWRRYPNGEVGSTVVLGGKYYMLFGGGHIYSSVDPIQGYRPDPVNWAFHTDGDGVHFSRLWNVEGDPHTVLLSHQWLTNSDADADAGADAGADVGAHADAGAGAGVDVGGPHNVWLAPLKQLQVGEDGTPRAIYWAGNDALKGEPITLPPLPPLPPPPPAAEQLDLASCDGSAAQWILPAVGAGPGPISYNATACLGVEPRSGVAVLEACP